MSCPLYRRANRSFSISIGTSSFIFECPLLWGQQARHGLDPSRRCRLAPLLDKPHLPTLARLVLVLLGLLVLSVSVVAGAEEDGFWRAPPDWFVEPSLATMPDTESLVPQHHIQNQNTAAKAPTEPATNPDHLESTRALRPDVPVGRMPVAADLLASPPPLPPTLPKVLPYTTPPLQLPAHIPLPPRPQPLPTVPPGMPTMVPTFRPLPLQAIDSGIFPAPSGNTWVPPFLEKQRVAEQHFLPAGYDYLGYERLSDADDHSLFWSMPLHYRMLPLDLLWKVPLANQREPRMYAKQSNLNGESTIETAIGTQFGLFSWRPPNQPMEGIQIDLFAAVFTRFNDRRLLTTSDYRVGVPVTYAKGPWQAKLSYEHTSTHLGDEFIEVSGRRQVPHVRDELVFGLARRFGERWRVYGQIGYSFLTSNVVGEDRDRYNCGIEYASHCPTGIWGKPFVAIDLDLRSDQDYEPNITVQGGWHWLVGKDLRGGRIFVEYYRGKSPYGQFFQDDEDWVAIVAALDW